jgi:hypothetical protein
LFCGHRLTSFRWRSYPEPGPPWSEASAVVLDDRHAPLEGRVRGKGGAGPSPARSSSPPARGRAVFPSSDG